MKPAIIIALARTMYEAERAHSDMKRGGDAERLLPLAWDQLSTEQRRQIINEVEAHLARTSGEGLPPRAYFGFEVVRQLRFLFSS